MRCGRCGNENAEGNRFCGMCGASLVVKPQASSAAAPTSPAPVERKVEPSPLRPSAEARIPRVPVSAGREAASQAVEDRVPPPVDTTPVITGPSFLGLNKPGDGRGADPHGSHHEFGRGHNPWERPSRNVDYLLEDDDEPRRGWGKLAMVVVALVLAGGFGYLHWKQGGFDWLINGKRAAPTAAESQQNPTGPGSASGAAATPEAANPNPANPNPSNSSASNPNPANPTPANSGAATAGTPAPPAASGTAANGAAEGGADSSAPASALAGGAPPNTAAAPSTAAQNAPPANTSPDGSTKPQQSDATPSSETPAGGAGVPASKPRPDVPSKPVSRARKPTPVTPVDPTAEAESYIYGHGVRQDCERGLRLLKPAAQSNVKAMISMGALYSTGTCTPRDLPTAYRWFALALHKQPDNLALQDDLQKLWSQMTQPERQLAIKLSQ
ncbi:MAG: zinc-ribbon domain-containing protein [Candidatus Sulfotelmatobacter sp.]